MIRYIVRVGGLAVCETKNLAKAQDIFRHWVMQDYDDVILEKVKP